MAGNTHSEVTYQIYPHRLLCRFSFRHMHTPVLFLCVSQEFLQFLYSLSCQPSNDHVFDGFHHFSFLTALTSGAQSGTCNAMHRQLIDAASNLKLLQLLGIKQFVSEYSLWCFCGLQQLRVLRGTVLKNKKQTTNKKQISKKVCMQNKMSFIINFVIN